jgi:hypothetical protein
MSWPHRAVKVLEESHLRSFVVEAPENIGAWIKIVIFLVLPHDNESVIDLELGHSENLGVAASGNS